MVALSSIIMAAMLGLIKYDEAYRLFKVDKFDFCICMAAFFGVTFISMDVGLLMSVSIGLNTKAPYDSTTKSDNRLYNLSVTNNAGGFVSGEDASVCS